LGHGKGYVYPHDEPGGWADQQYRPAGHDSLYYRPTGRGADVADHARDEADVGEGDR
jgi:putative ATPase